MYTKNVAKQGLSVAEGLNLWQGKSSPVPLCLPVFP